MNTITNNETTMLENLDNLYKASISKLPAEFRICYCKNQLSKLQYLFEKNNPAIEPEWYECHNNVMMALLLQPIKEMIRAIQNEIKQLENK